MRIEEPEGTGIAPIAEVGRQRRRTTATLLYRTGGRLPSNPSAKRARNPAAAAYLR